MAKVLLLVFIAVTTYLCARQNLLHFHFCSLGPDEVVPGVPGADTGLPDCNFDHAVFLNTAFMSTPSRFYTVGSSNVTLFVFVVLQQK